MHPSNIYNVAMETAEGKWRYPHESLNHLDSRRVSEFAVTSALPGRRGGGIRSSSPWKKAI